MVTGCYDGRMWLLVLLLLVPPAQVPTDIVRWSVTGPEKPVAPGGVAKLHLSAQIEDGWKLYALSQPSGGPIALSIGVEKSAPFKLVQKEISGPLPKVQRDPNFKLDTQFYEREAAFVVPVVVPKTAAGKKQVPIEITFQACGAEICLRPFTHKLTADVVVSR